MIGCSKTGTPADQECDDLTVLFYTFCYAFLLFFSTLYDFVPSLSLSLPVN